MSNIWWIYVSVYLILIVIYTQVYKTIAKKSKNTSALTVLLRFVGGASILIAIPFFEFKIPSDPKVYLFLAVSCAFYALSDRMYTASLKKLEVSTYSFLGQLSNIFIFTFGLVFFKEPLIIKRVFGALLILFANIMVLYKKGKLELNKYSFFNIIANFSFAVGTTLSIGISDLFNLPLYVGILLCSSSFFIFVTERIKIKDIKREYKLSNKKSILTVGILDGITSVIMFRAYQLGDVTLLAPLFSLRTILNVFAAHIFLKEKKSLLKKVIAGIIVVIGIIFMNA